MRACSPVLPFHFENLQFNATMSHVCMQNILSLFCQSPVMNVDENTYFLVT